MMKSTSMLLIALVVLGASLSRADPNTKSLMRDPRSIGSGQSSDVIISPDNATLEEVLDNLVSNTNLVMTSGTYNIASFAPVMGISNIGIFGRGDVTITCSSNVGLAFINVTDLVIDGVRIEGCGLSGSNLDQVLTQLRQFIDLFYVVYPEMRFAVFIGHCENVMIENVQVANNIGFGLVGINVIGSSLVRQLRVINNTQPSSCMISITSHEVLTDPQKYGGGAVFLYQDYLSNYQGAYGDQVYDLTIQNGLFTKNSECSFNYLSFFRFGDPAYVRNLGYRIGGGGGLALLIGQLNYGISVLTNDTHFEDNRGTLGGSAHVSLFSGVKNTQVVFSNCTFTKNNNEERLRTSTIFLAGGGLGVASDLSRPQEELTIPPHVVHNLNTSLRIVRSRFTDNVGSFGAAFYFYSAYRSAVSDLTDVVYVYLEDCLFERNLAFIGAAIQTAEFKTNAANVGTQFKISDTDFINNNIITIDPNGTQSILQSAGIIDIQNMNVSLSGNCRLEANQGTALRAEMSYIGIAGNITFRGNTGIRGGALHLTSYSYLIVLPNSSLYLLNNVARESGGAIYSNFLGMNSYIIGGTSDCFLAFSYDTLGLCVNCSDLNSTGSYIKFEGNVAASGSEIFGSAFATCPWVIGLMLDVNNKSALEQISEMFPNIFDFSRPPVGPRFVKTQSQTLTIVDRNSTSVYDPETMVYSVLPGQTFNLTFVARDNFNQTISNVISSFVSSDIPLLLNPNRSASPFISSSNFGLLRDDEPTQLPVIISATEGQNLSVVIYSTDPVGRAQVDIDIIIGYCGDGFIFNRSNEVCDCDPSLLRLRITCDPENQLLITENDIWLGPVDDTGLLGVDDCPLTYCQFGRHIIPVVNGRAKFDTQCASTFGRTGVLCGQCQEGLSFVLGSPRCLDCTNVSILLFPVFLLLGILLIFLIYIFDITVTRGLINGAIFYSNLVSLYSVFLFPSSASPTTVIVSFLTLNLGIESCLYDGMGSLELQWWQLSFPLYLFSLMGIITLLARTKYFQVLHKNQGSSVIRAFVTLMLLCYVSVLQVSVQLLGFVKIETADGSSTLRWIINPSIGYFQNGHVPLALISIFLGLFYLIPFPLFLMFPSLLYRSKYLSKFKPVYDALWHPFEPKFRFWLGLRLILRWLPFILLFLTRNPINVIITDILLILLLFIQLVVKPFKDKWINTVDAVFILVLVLMFTGSLYFTAEAKTNNEDIESYFDTAATIYNQVLMVLGFLLLCGIVGYHLFVRFPKLKAFLLGLWGRIRNKKGQPSPEASHTNPEQGTELKESTPQTQTPIPKTVATCSELREPLLEESGFATVIRVNTPDERHTN